MLRRLKTVELLDQLPRKTEICVFVPLTDLQARVYTRFLASADAQTLLGAADEGDPTGPLWRMSYPSQDHLRDDYKQRRRALLGFVLEFVYMLTGNSDAPPLVLCRPVLVLLQRMCSHVELIKTPLPKDEPNPHRRAMRRELSEELLPAGRDRDAAGK